MGWFPIYFDSFLWAAPVRVSMLSDITAVITEPEPAINHFKNTRKSGFACITLLSGSLLQVRIKELMESRHLRDSLTDANCFGGSCARKMK